MIYKPFKLERWKDAMKRSFKHDKITVNKTREYKWYKTKNQKKKSTERCRSAKQSCEYNNIIAANVYITNFSQWAAFVENSFDIYNTLQ